MADKALGLQDNFLNHVRRAKVPVTIFLVKGVKLQGIITWFDSFSLLLRRDGSAQLVYKHSISTIMPAQVPDGFVAPETIVQAGEGRRAPLQDLFLGASARQHEAMTVFLVNGVMLTGEVASFDQFCVLLERGGLVQLVYKHAISTLQPAHSLTLDPESDAEESD
jgi:host factor-I protein